MSTRPRSIRSSEADGEVEVGYLQVQLDPSQLFSLTNCNISAGGDIVINSVVNATITRATSPLLKCGCSQDGRNLVVCFDGTSNQFGHNNTNVVELYSELENSKKQITYYNSGIGTYVTPSAWWSSKKQYLYNGFDLAFAWNLKKIILAAYRWLSENYEEYDRIYLFGFSRGAYQVRILAGMIHKVGLIRKGNEEQIPFAYELYVDPKSDLIPESGKAEFKFQEPMSLARRFKTTFSRQNVGVHFVGVWDTVSSTDVVRGEDLPLTHEIRNEGPPRHICIFRHALALDERRVKFLPEYVRGGLGPKIDEKGGATGWLPDVKEVWFPGTHSDMCWWGNQPNLDLDLGKPSLQWMRYEAISGGLVLQPRNLIWDFTTLADIHESMTMAWPLVENLPIKRLTYKDENSTTIRPHRQKGRKMMPGQKIHSSVALCNPYVPKAFLPVGTKFTWKELVGVGGPEKMDWAKNPIYELDIFDDSTAEITAKDLLTNLSFSDRPPDLVKMKSLCFRLEILTWSSKGCSALMRVENSILSIIGCLGCHTDVNLDKKIIQVLNKLQLGGFLDNLTSIDPGNLNSTFGDRRLEVKQLDNIFKALFNLVKDDTAKQITLNVFSELIILYDTHHQREFEDNFIDVLKAQLSSPDPLAAVQTMSPAVFYDNLRSQLMSTFPFAITAQCLDNKDHRAKWRALGALGMALQYDPELGTRIDESVKSAIQRSCYDDHLDVWQEAHKICERMGWHYEYNQGSSVPSLRHISSEERGLVALVIVIDKYPGNPGFKGGAIDASDITTSLLNVKNSGIVCLQNEAATRENIIGAFLRLQRNEKITPGDPILIYYAGDNDGQLGSEASRNNIQAIMPYDVGVRRLPTRQTIDVIPVFPLLNDLARIKGTNITLILDCSHASSGPHPHRRSNVDRETCLQRDRRSHVLLAASDAHSDLKENRGAFTQALLKTWKEFEFNIQDMTYTDVMERLRIIPRKKSDKSQNPQCEGYYKNRNLFTPPISTKKRGYIRVRRNQNTYMLEAGIAHGVSINSEFAVYRDQSGSREALYNSKCWVKEVHTLESVLELPDGTEHDLLETAYARQVSGMSPRDLRVDLKIGEDLLPEVRHQVGISVNEDADVLVRVDPFKQEATFENVALPKDLQLERLPYTVQPEAVPSVLNSMARWVRHINRRGPEPCPVYLEFTRLEHRDRKWDEEGMPIMNPEGPNLNHNDIVEIESSLNFYGVKIVNRTDVHFYPYLFYFNANDQTIESYYLGSTGTTRRSRGIPPPLRANSSLTVGYGASGELPLTFLLRDREECNVGFLKVFLTTSPSDFSFLEQDSPFSNVHIGHPVSSHHVVSNQDSRPASSVKEDLPAPDALPNGPGWATAMLTIKQRSSRQRVRSMWNHYGSMCKRQLSMFGQDLCMFGQSPWVPVKS